MMTYKSCEVETSFLTTHFQMACLYSILWPGVAGASPTFSGDDGPCLLSTDTEQLKRQKDGRRLNHIPAAGRHDGDEASFKNKQKP